MSERPSIAVIDRVKDRVHAFVSDYCKRLQGCHYIDVRTEVSEAKGAYARNGTAKESSEDAELSRGVGVHAGKSMVAQGYFGRALGSTPLQQLGAVLSDGVDHVHPRVRANTARKLEAERVLQFGRDLTPDAVDLAGADRLDSTPIETTIVTDPHDNALLVHEIVGHLVEADRALKMETGYTGNPWLYRSPQDNMLGQLIASEQVTAYADTALQGLGMSMYDAEGVRAKRVIHIGRGIFKGFLNSRETVAILAMAPELAVRRVQAGNATDDMG